MSRSEGIVVLPTSEAVRFLKKSTGYVFVTIAGTETAVIVMKVDLITQMTERFGDEVRWLITWTDDGTFVEFAEAL